MWYMHCSPKVLKYVLCTYYVHVGTVKKSERLDTNRAIVLEKLIHWDACVSLVCTEAEYCFAS